MKKFLPVNEDLQIFNDLKAKINTVKKNTVQEIELPLNQDKRIKHKKEQRNCLFISVILLAVSIVAIILFFNKNFLILLGLTVLLSLFLLVIITTSFYSYINSDIDFEKSLININLSSITLNTDELKFISKFMEKERLEEFLSENGLKLSLNLAKHILESEYYQDHYIENMAHKIVSEL